MAERKQVSISYEVVDRVVWEIQRHLMWQYGTDQAVVDISPLTWYINTGRASTDFLRALVQAKPFMIARRLHKGGSHDEVIARIKKFLGEDEQE